MMSWILLKNWKRITASTFLITNCLYALTITHQLRPNGNFDTLSLANACSTITGTSFSVRCNPALFPYSKEEGILITGAGKSDGDSIDNGRDLIFDPITEPLIAASFRKKTSIHLHLIPILSSRTAFLNCPIPPTIYWQIFTFIILPSRKYPSI